MGEEDLRRRTRTALRSASALAAAALLVVAAGCGGDSDDEVRDPQVVQGPRAPQGNVAPSPAILRGGDGFATLTTAQLTTGTDNDTLVVGQVEVTSSQRPRLRLLVDGENEGDVDVSIVSEGDSEAAVLSCACRFEGGEHELELQAASNRGTTKVGASTLVAFTGVKLEQAGSDPLTGSTLDTELVRVPPEGATLASLRPRVGENEPLLAVAALSAPPGSGSDPSSLRLELVAGDEVISQITTSNLPESSLASFYHPDGIEVGEELTLRAFSVAGEGKIGITSLATCACTLQR